MFLKSPKQLKGNQAENQAVKYLQKNKYHILERNFHCKLGEIDIIAIQNKTLVFVEVKLRTNQDYGNILEAITPKKLKSIKKTIDYYIYENKLQSVPIRIDFIGIENGEITHLKSIGDNL